MTSHYECDLMLERNVLDCVGLSLTNITFILEKNEVYCTIFQLQILNTTSNNKCTYQSTVQNKYRTATCFGTAMTSSRILIKELFFKR